jgi:hypothetical protein
MARGFESKAVADQQETARDRRRRASVPEGAVDPLRLARKRQLELARADVARRLGVAVAPAHRQMLERALRALDTDLAALGS